MKDFVAIFLFLGVFLVSTVYFVGLSLQNEQQQNATWVCKPHEREFICKVAP